MKNSKYVLFFVFILVQVCTVYAQQHQAITLWPDGAPGANSDGGEEIINIYESTGDHLISNIHDPSITPYIPSAENATGIAIVIAPGGGHREIWIDHEGYNVAQLLSENGIAAFILKYRLARDENSTYTVEKHSVRDMLRAIRLVRSRAGEWNIDPDKVGIIGFSAGGQIAGLADMYADSGRTDTDDPVDTFSSKPNFQALIYPGWINGIVPSEQSSPAFILGGYKDMESISTGMAELYLKFKELEVPAELHIYANASHGFGIRQGDTGASSKWPAALIAWLHDVNGIDSD
jgi:endo-1,4-beta-xylanase